MGSDVSEVSVFSRDPGVELAAAQLERRSEEIAAEMIDAYISRVPSYRTADPESMADVSEWAKGSILVSTGIVTGRLSAQDFVEALTEVGRRRAEQGFPLHDVLVANLIGTEILWQNVSSAPYKDLTERLEVQEVFMRASMSLLQHAVTALSEGYLEVTQARAADEEHDVQTMVEVLAGLRPADRRHEERADARGIDLKQLRWCAIARCKIDSIGDQVRAVRRAHPQGLVGRIGAKLIAFIPGEEPPSLAVSPAGVAHADDTASGYRRALAALQVATHLERDHVLYEEFVPLAMILAGPEEDKNAFVRAQLGPLIEDPMGGELMRSLKAYYRCGQSIAAAARDLYVHRHTLEYRLSRIEVALGSDIRDPEKRMLLELALSLHRT